MSNSSLKDVCDSLVFAFAAGLIAVCTILALAVCCSAADLSIGEKIDIKGNIKTDGCIEWSDNTLQCNASTVDLSDINSQIVGLQTNQQALFQSMQYKQDISEKGQVNGYAALDDTGKVPASQLPESIYGYAETRLHMTDPEPQWQTQGNAWASFVPQFDLVIDKQRPNSYLRLTYTDSIGIYGASWCNVGIFLNDEPTPVCTGAWFGVLGTTTFNQQTFSCLVPLPAGQYTITARHRSDACIYGMYGFDEYGLNRRLTAEEL